MDESSPTDVDSRHLPRDAQALTAHTASMVVYRRNRIPGSTYFFTVALRDRSSRLLVNAAAELRMAYAGARRHLPFDTIAIVVLPDHLHAVWRLPEGDADYSGRWRAIKGGFVRNLRRSGRVVRTNGKGEAEIWQRRFWEHTIRDEADLHTHVNYVHWNPVKHGHVVRTCDWPYSSFHHMFETAFSQKTGAAKHPCLKPVLESNSGHILLRICKSREMFGPRPGFRFASSGLPLRTHHASGVR